MSCHRTERNTDKIAVIVPNHCSEIPVLHPLRNSVGENDTESCTANFQHTEQFTPLIVHVLNEGVMWRGLCPLFQIDMGTNHQHDNHQHSQQDTHYTSNNRFSPSHSRLLQRRRRFFYDWVRRQQLTTAKSPNRNENKALSKNLLKQIIVFPPYTAMPNFYSCSLFITWEHTLIRLQSLQAYTSTLGGGYFFCGQLYTAIELARYQRKLALALHDDHAAGICTVNEAYNFIHAGYIQKALHILSRERTLAEARKDDLLLSMIVSAHTFAMRVQEFHASHPQSMSKQPKSLILYDDYYRIRVL